MIEDSFLVVQQRLFRFRNPLVMTKMQAQTEHLEVRSHSGGPRSIAQEVPMRRRWIGMLLLVGVVALAASSPSFVINGKTVKLETLEKNGKVYVEVQSFAKSLGVSVSVDKAKNQFVIVTTGKAPSEVAGTAQLAGGAGELGQAYTLGKVLPLNFMLRSAEFSVTRVTIGRDVYAPNANEKLLILHYTVQNPTKQDQNFSYASFRFTAVDSKDINHVFDGYIAKDGTTESLDLNLKPAQKIDALAVWTFPAAGPVPKLIVQRGGETDTPVLRYDLRGKVKPLIAPFADPSDPSGSSALSEIQAKPGGYYPLKIFDIKLEGISFAPGPVDGRLPSEGKRYLLAGFSIKNGAALSAEAAPYSYGSFGFTLKDSDGEKTEFGGNLLKASRDEPADGSLKPGEEYRFRVYFELSLGVAGQTLSVSDRNSRVYVFDISGLK
jgi:hypothetical protein